MVVRISRRLFAERRIPVMGDVAITFQPFGYSEFKSIEAMSMRLAREAMDDVDLISTEVLDDEDLSPELMDRLSGLCAQFTLDALVIAFATGWEGVQIDDDPEPPLTPETWVLFREENPILAAHLHRKLESPVRTVDFEGNGSAPLPNGAVKAG